MPNDSATDIDEARAIRQAAIDAEFDRKYAAAGGTPITPTGVVPANQCISGTMTGSIYSDALANAPHLLMDGIKQFHIAPEKKLLVLVGLIE